MKALFGQSESLLHDLASANGDTETRRTATI